MPTRLGRFLLPPMCLAVAVAVQACASCPTGGTAAVAAEPACAGDADCVPDLCCHPTACVPAGAAPACEAVRCTMDCRGPLDCGAGSCACVQGACAVRVLRQPPGDAGIPP